MISLSRPVILVTGCSGLIGARFTARAIEHYVVVGLDRNPPAPGDRLDAWIACDLTDGRAVELALDRVRHDHGTHLASVVHLAAYYDFSGEPSHLYNDLTVEGTRRLLRGLQAFHVEQFVFTSTLLVHEPAEDERPLTSDSPTSATWDYPASKLAAERVIAADRGGIPAVVLRIAGVYDEDCHSIPLGQQISRIYQRDLEGYVFPGDADKGQSFIHLNDVVESMLATVERRAVLAAHEVFLIGEEDVMSYAELQEQLGILIHGEAWPAIRIPKFVAKVGAWIQGQFASPEAPPFIKPWMIDLADQHYPVSLAEATSQLGWRTTHSLRRTLPEMIRRLRAHPAEWYATNHLTPPTTLAEHAEPVEGNHR